MRFLRTPALAALTAGALVALSGCGSDGTAGSGGDFTVVTSTNVYADIVSRIAGDAATVIPIISDQTTDPHSYEATAHDQLKLSKADLVVVNGGGYDAFMTTMLEAADHTPTIVDAVAVSGLPGSEGLGNEGHDHDHGAEEGHDHGSEEGHDHDHGAGAGHDHEGHDHGSEDAHDHDHDHGAFNEHVWYSVPTMEKLTAAVAEDLSKALPDHADAIRKNAEDYSTKLGQLHERIEEAKAAHGGEKAAATEPIPLWLFHDMGIDSITPPEFLAAVEHGDDVPPLVLRDAKAQIENKEVVILGYNSQTAGPQADELKSSAQAAGIPVVELAETLPEGEEYTAWMGGYIDDIDRALAGHNH